MKILQHIKPVTGIWLILMALTVLSMLIAESGNPSGMLNLLVCGVFAVKGQLVIDHFMGMYSAGRTVRWIMLSYFYVLAPLIGAALCFPDLIVSLTSL